MKTNNKLSAYILRGSTAALLFSCVIVALCSAIHLPEQSHKAPAPQDNATFGANAHQSRSLSFAERVANQRAIEDVYWRHRIWPDTNAGPKPPLDAVMSQGQLEKKVEDYLRNSQTVENDWQRPITADQLQAEMERMASHTKQPDVLRELFNALGNDPFVIAECLARPVLTERLIADLSVQDQTERLESLRTAETQMPNKVAAIDSIAEAVRVNRPYQLPVVGTPSGSCTDDTWTPTTLTNAPDARYLHTAVWTGSEMIVWGGGDGTVYNTGGRYNPTTNSWTVTSINNAPEARVYHTAVWTGSEMIVWGGDGIAGNVNTGGRYNPITDSWTATSTTNAPEVRRFHTAVWSGSEMIVWGGLSGSRLNTGGRYNPSTDSWTATSTTNAPEGRSVHTAVWDDLDNLMIVWGGENNTPEVVNTGGRYDPSTDSWTATTTSNAPDPREFPYNSQIAVWTGSEMIVWGGLCCPPGGLNTGGRYNPGTDSWTATSMINVPTARYENTAVWTGSEMIVWAGLFGDNTGGRYDPGTDSWRPTSIINVPSSRRIHTAVWTGSEMIVWGGTDACCPIVVTNTGGRYCAQSPTPSPTPACPPEYLINQIGDSIVPGTTDIDNHGDNVVTTIALPFPYTLYDQTFTQIALDSNGKAHFLSGTSDFTNTCLPYTVVTYAAFPYWDDQLTNAQDGCAAFPGGTCGIFTSVSGTEPNRIFNIEWRTVYFNDISQAANYELRLYEGQTRFDVIYGAVAQGNTSATAGVQRDHTFFDQYFCDGSGGAATGGQSYILQPCGTPSPTPTATPTATPRVTPRPRPTAHPRP